jgi:hypothetical protein
VWTALNAKKRVNTVIYQVAEEHGDSQPAIIYLFKAFFELP